jgi:hypothetical protein
MLMIQLCSLTQEFHNDIFLKQDVWKSQNKQLANRMAVLTGILVFFSDTLQKCWDNTYYSITVAFFEVFEMCYSLTILSFNSIQVQLLMVTLYIFLIDI